MLKLIISNSMAASNTECSTQAVLRTLGYTGDPSENPKMVAGGSAHLLLEAWLQGKHPDECLKVFEDSYRKFSDFYVPDKGYGSQLRWENLDKILSTYLGLNALNAVDFEVLETERQLSIEIYKEPGLTIHFSDKMDGKACKRIDGSCLSIEHKTGEFIDENWFDRYSMDGQITGHVFAGNSTGPQVVGVMVNAIQFNKLPDLNDPSNLKKNGEFRQCKTHKMPLNACALDHVKWARREFIRTADDVEQWKHELISGALDYYKSLVDCKGNIDGIKYVRMQGLLHRACSRCSFRNFCNSHKSNMNYLLKAPARDSSVLSSGLFEVTDES